MFAFMQTVTYTVPYSQYIRLASFVLAYLAFTILLFRSKLEEVKQNAIGISFMIVALIINPFFS